MARTVLRRSHHDREIGRLALPALGQLAAEPLYVIVDTAVVGHLGTDQLAGLAVAGVLLTALFWAFNFLSYGTTAAVARLHGAGDRRASAEQAVQSLWLAAGLGLVLLVVGAVLASPAVDLVGASPDVRPFALTYLRISLLGMPALLMTLAGMGYFRGLHNNVTPLVIAVVANVVNLVLELVLIYGFGWGIEASAWGTVVAQVGAAAVFVAYVLRDARAHAVTLQPHGRHLRALALVGRDLFVRTGALLLALALATSVAARISDRALAAHQIAYQIWIFLALTLDAVAIAAQSLVGSYLGAADAHSARSSSHRMLEWGLVAGILFAGVILAVRPVLPHLFTGDEAVVDLLESVLVYVAVLQPLNAAVFVLDGILMGAGDFRYLAVAMVVALVVFVPLAMGVLSLDLGLDALWLALGVLMATRLLGNWSRFSSARWEVLGRVRS